MSFEGHVEGFALSDFFQAIHLGGRTGLARVTRGDRSSTILFREGRIECASASGERQLGSVLIRKQIITADDLTRALKAQRERHRHLLLCSMISELGIASYRKLEVETEEYIRGVIAKVLSWEDGVFVFQPHSIPHEVSVLNKGLSVEELLLSGMFTTETVSGFEEQPIEDEAEW